MTILHGLATAEQMLPITTRSYPLGVRRAGAPPPCSPSARQPDAVSGSLGLPRLITGGADSSGGPAPPGQSNEAVIDLAGLDDDTALAFHTSIARIWPTAPAVRTTRDAGEPGARLRMDADLRQVSDERFAPERA
jgi:hypothetical protein